ncbi:hypothetical protein ZOSMA_246G00310 [Zostera marina]|uniref:TF-B3 domain-containing protein n=1 Tax=Zostera marina TaxID=29655 RepID=A0A0K9PGY8_ZOSMR|nr:hypothetical protein ZOSMA_246G00310 [Zostera marina]
MSDMTGTRFNSHTKPMFFCILKPDFLSKMDIPPAFIWNLIPEKIAKVWDSLGHSWLFKIRGTHPNFYFDEGWKKFAKTFNLEVGYMLLFCYEGNMNFSVIIFGNNSCLKEYALEFIDKSKKNTIERLYTRDDLDKSIDHKKIKLEAPNPSSLTEIHNAQFQQGCGNQRLEHLVKMPEKFIATTIVADNGSAFSLTLDSSSRTKEEQRHEHACLPLKIPLCNHTDTDGTVLNTVQPYDHDDEQQAAQASNTINDGSMICAENAPPSYRITLMPSHLQGRYYLYIPVRFREQTGISDEHTLFLKDPNNNLWETQLSHSTKNRLLVSRGWKEFCLNNKLKLGDDCEFKFCSELKDNKKILQVEIFKKPQRERLKAIKIKKTCGTNLSSTPSFWITVTSYCLVQNNIAIPNAFVTATDLLHKNTVELKDDTDGYICPVDLRHSTRNRVIFGNSSWKKFCSRYNFKEGDILAFQFESKSGSNGIDTFHFRILQEPPLQDEIE